MTPALRVLIACINWENHKAKVYWPLKDVTLQSQKPDVMQRKATACQIHRELERFDPAYDPLDHDPQQQAMDELKDQDY